MLKRREFKPDKIRAKAAKRLERLNTTDVLSWADQAGTGIAKALDDYRRLSLDESLLEAQNGISALAGAVDVLSRRAAKTAAVN